MNKLLMSVAIAALAATHAWADDIKIGATAPLSGPQAMFGEALFNGADIYLDEINAAGGINGQKLVLERQDDKADPKEGTLVAQKFCDDSSIVALIGPLNSGVGMPGLPIYNDCNLPQVIMGSNPQLTEQSVSNMVQPAPNDFAQGGLAAAYAKEDLGATKAAIVHDKQVFGQGVSEIFAKSFADMGGTVVATSAVNPTDIDFSAVITQLKAQNPEVVYMGAVMPQISLMAKQMKEQGLKATLIVPDGGYTPDFVTQAGADAAEGVAVTFSTPPTDATDGLKELVAKYKTKYGAEMHPYGIYGYVAGQMIAAAIKNAGEPTREKIVPALKATNLDTLLGNIQFDETGKLKKAPMFLYVFKNSQLVLVKQQS